VRVFDYAQSTGKPFYMNTFITAFYDAVLLYALALRETIDAGGDPRNGTAVTKRMWNRTFEGLASNVTIDKNGDRYCDYFLLALDPRKNEFVEVAVYSMQSRALTVLGSMHWIGEEPPHDQPVCGWDDSLCPQGRHSEKM
jgi:atrial natriuretic peptide receptor A